MLFLFQQMPKWKSSVKHNWSKCWKNNVVMFRVPVKRNVDYKWIGQCVTMISVVFVFLLKCLDIFRLNKSLVKIKFFIHLWHKDITHIHRNRMSSGPCKRMCTCVNFYHVAPFSSHHIVVNFPALQFIWKMIASEKYTENIASVLMAIANERMWTLYIHNKCRKILSLAQYVYPFFHNKCHE